MQKTLALAVGRPGGVAGALLQRAERGKAAMAQYVGIA